jgi:DNA replication and repair protein RecF
MSEHEMAEGLVLKRLSLLNFKNYEEIELNFSPQINCFVGNNGEGKTNLLDAIYYTAFCKSYFHNIESYNIRHGSDFLTVDALFGRTDKDERIQISYKKGDKKKVRRNKKEYDRISDHVGLIPLVIISPSDKDLITEGSELRRKFVDGVISQTNKTYLDNLLQYNRLLAQRNSLLKYFAANRTFDVEQLSIYDEQLSELSKPIHLARVDFLEDFRPIFHDVYQRISGSDESVEMNYKSHLTEYETAMEMFAESRDRDRVLQFTSKGIHKDDLKLTIQGYPIKKLGSQGQQKTFVIALKIAQFEFLKNANGFKPLLLLDDIFDKLDDSRVEAIIRMVNDHRFGQIFITDTHPERTEETVQRVNESYSMFRIKKGRVI